MLPKSHLSTASENLWFPTPGVTQGSPQCTALHCTASIHTQGSLLCTALHAVHCTTLHTALHPYNLNTVQNTAPTALHTSYCTLHFSLHYTLHCTDLHFTALHCIVQVSKGPSERPMYDIQVTSDLGTVLYCTVLY